MLDADSSSVSSYPAGDLAISGDDPACSYGQTQAGTTDPAVGQPTYTMYSRDTYPATYDIATSQPYSTTNQSGSGYQYQGQATGYPTSSSYQYPTGTTNTDTYLQQETQDIQEYYPQTQPEDTSAADWAGYATGTDADMYWQEDSQFDQASSSAQPQTADNAATDYQNAAASSSTQRRTRKHGGKKRPLVTESLGERGNPYYDKERKLWINTKKCDQCLRDRRKECCMQKRSWINCEWVRSKAQGAGKASTFYLDGVEPYPKPGYLKNDVSRFRMDPGAFHE